MELTDTGSGDGSKAYTINGVNGDIDIRATYAKRPKIILNAECDDGGSAPGAVKAVQNGKPVASLSAGEASASGTVAYSSTGDIVVTADPEKGYEAVGFTVKYDNEFNDNNMNRTENVDGTGNDSDNSRTYIIPAGNAIVRDNITVTSHC